MIVDNLYNKRTIKEDILSKCEFEFVGEPLPKMKKSIAVCKCKLNSLKSYIYSHI